MAPRLPLRFVLTLALTAALAACSDTPQEPRLPDQVEAAWKAFRAEPNDATYLRFLDANRTAAFEHAREGNPHDAVGVLHQVRAVEAQADQACRAGDLDLAQSVVMRVEEIEEGEVIDVYDEVLPGARERLRAARLSVLDMLE